MTFLFEDVCVSQDMERNVLEWVSHFHEGVFADYARLNEHGRYAAPQIPGYSMEMLVSKKPCQKNFDKLISMNTEQHY